MKRVLVSGANGFIGRALCSSLQRADIEVIALLRTATTGDWQRSLLCDLQFTAPKADALTGVDVVFHLAGKAHAINDPKEDANLYESINAEGTRHLLEASIAAGVKRFVYFSSVKAMGDVTYSEENENTPCHPMTAYGLSKLHAEELLLQHQNDIEVVILRPCMVYGSQQKGNLQRMFSLMRKHLVPPLPHYANHRSMVHVEDLIQAAWLAAQCPQASGQTFIVNDGKSYATRDIYDAINKALGRTPARWHIPHMLLLLFAKLGDGMGLVLRKRMLFDSQALQRLQSSAQYSTQKIQQQLGYQPKHNLYDFLDQLTKG